MLVDTTEFTAGSVVLRCGSLWLCRSGVERAFGVLLNYGETVSFRVADKAKHAGGMSLRLAWGARTIRMRCWCGEVQWPIAAAAQVLSGIEGMRGVNKVYVGIRRTATPTE